MCHSQRLNRNGKQPTTLENNLVQTRWNDCLANHREALTGVTGSAVTFKAQPGQQRSPYLHIHACIILPNFKCISVLTFVMCQLFVAS